MLSTPTQLLGLSQAQLNLLEVCPRKFQHIYLEQLKTALDPQDEEKQILGSRFHLLMQQQEMGLPIQSFLQADAQLQSWMANVVNAAPEIFTAAIDNQTFRESEHYRTLQVQDYLLTVIYDLLIADSQQAQIFDWKTSTHLPNHDKLAENWQTRLYMYVLAETSAYLPEQISMTYWFVQSEEKPQKIKFSYNSQQHQKTANQLNQLLSQLSHWLEDYQQNKLFPQLGIAKSALCNNCQFASKCLRIPVSESKPNPTSLPNLDNIQEVSI